MEYKTIRSVLLVSALAASGAASSGCSGYRLVDHGSNSGKYFEKVDDKPRVPSDPEKAKQYLQELGDLRARKFEMPPEKYVEAFRELQRKYGSLSDSVRPVSPVQPETPVQPPVRPVEPVQSQRQGRGWRDTLRYMTVEPVRTPQNDSWAKRYVADPINGLLLGIGQASKLFGGTGREASRAYERHVPVSIRTGLAAGAWYQGLDELDRLAVDQNWQSPHHSAFGHEDDGPRITPPGPTSNPPLGVNGPAPNPQEPNNPAPFFGGGSAD